MNESTARNLTRFKYAATLLGAMAVFALAPATAHALPVNNGAGDGGCHYTVGRSRSASARTPPRPALPDAGGNGTEPIRYLADPFHDCRRYSCDATRRRARRPEETGC
jgi:hypothetical protein